MFRSLFKGTLSLIFTLVLFACIPIFAFFTLGSFTIGNYTPEGRGKYLVIWIGTGLYIIAYFLTLSRTKVRRTKNDDIQTSTLPDTADQIQSTPADSVQDTVTANLAASTVTVTIDALNPSNLSKPDAPKPKRAKKTPKTTSPSVTLPCPGCGAPAQVKKGETILCPYCGADVAG